MSWCKAAALAALGFVLAGCGFRPLDEAPGVAEGFPTVHVAQIAERHGQIMTNDLDDRFHPRGEAPLAAYQLEVSLIENRYDLAIREDGTASRNDFQLTANYALRRLSDKKVVVTGTAHAQTGHDVLDNEYANVVSGQNDEEHAIKAVDDDIQTRLALYFRGNDGKP